MTEEEEKKDFKGHQHMCCVECGSHDRIAYVAGYTVCFNCIKAFKKRHNIEHIVLDNWVANNIKQMLEYTKREEEKKKDHSVG